MDKAQKINRVKLSIVTEDHDLYKREITQQISGICTNRGKSTSHTRIFLDSILHANNSFVLDNPLTTCVVDIRLPKYT